MYIVGEFDPAQIRCNEKAMEETIRLDEKSEKLIMTESEFFQNASLLIGYVNVRSLGAHWKHVQKDFEMMQCDVLGFGETWLEKGQSVDHIPFFGHYLNAGKGKGLSSFTKLQPTSTEQILKEKYSLMKLVIDNKIIIFMYISQHPPYCCCIKDIDSLIESSSMPTILLGDVNFDYSLRSHPIKDFLLLKKFTQLIKDPTHDEGGLIDHVYVNDAMMLLDVNIFKKPVCYSDHDEIFVRIN